MNRQNKKIFGTLFFSIFATVTGVGIVVPLLPVYAHELGAGGLYIGLIFGAFSLSRTFFMPYFGRLSDKKGRKPYIVAGLLAYALISIAFIFSTGIETLIAIRFFQGIASAMIMPIAQAYIGDITPPGREGFAMGLFNMSVFCGLSIGPLAGGMISDYFSLSTAFAAMGVLGLLGFILSLFLLPPTQSEPVIRDSKKLSGWKQLLKDRDIAGFFLFRLAYTTCIGIIWAFLPVFADTEFSLSPSSIGILVMLGVFVNGLIHTPMGFLADKVNRRMLVLAGGLVTGFAILLFEWAGGFGDLFLASVLFGIGGGVSMPALMALAVLKGSHANAMGSVMALLTMAHSLGMLAGSLLGGLMMDIFSLRLAFTCGAFAMVAGTILFMIFTTHNHLPRRS
jgi:MFS family permease